MRTHTNSQCCHLTAWGQLAVRGRRNRERRRKQRETWIGLLNGSCAAFEVSCSEGEIYRKVFGDMGVVWGERWRQGGREKETNNFSDGHILIQTHLLCTQGPPWTPGCPSAAAAVSECGRHLATSSYKQSAPRWWPAGAGRHLLRYRWWRAAWAGCLSRSARSLVSIQSHQHAPRAQTETLPSFVSLMDGRRSMLYFTWKHSFWDLNLLYMMTFL